MRPFVILNDDISIHDCTSVFFLCLNWLIYSIFYILISTVTVKRNLLYKWSEKWWLHLPSDWYALIAYILCLWLHKTILALNILKKNILKPHKPTLYTFNLPLNRAPWKLINIFYILCLKSTSTARSISFNIEMSYVLPFAASHNIGSFINIVLALNEHITHTHRRISCYTICGFSATLLPTSAI